MSRTLIDISRLGTDTSWPAVATEVNGYLQNWLTAANAQVSQHQLRLATAPNPTATATDPCGWRLEATLAQLTPGGDPAVLLLEVFLTGTTLQIKPGIANREPFLGGDDQVSWVYPSGEVGTSSGAWSTTPLPFNAQVGWSLAPGAEYFVFAYSQHRFTNRQAMPLLIARDQVSGHWILAASPPSTTTDALRAVSWNVRSGQPAGSRTLLRESFTTAVMIRRPAELVLATTDWSYYENANEPAQFWEPLLLPPDFAVVNFSSAAMSYFKPPDGSEWLAIGGHGLLLRTKDAPAPQGGDGAMTYQVFCQSFAPGTWKWTGKEPAGVGLQLDASFRAFAALVNALPGNATTPLSVVRSHADATANRWGYTWQLGHPLEPAHLWFLTETTGTVPQGETQSSSSAVFGNALASTFTNNTSNGGYGSYSNSSAYGTGLAYLDSTLSGATAIGAVLLIAQDTTPGKEFFCWALKTHGGNDDLHRDCCHALYKSPGTTGWNSIAVFPRTSKQFYGQVVLHGYSGSRFGGLPSGISSSIHANGHQLRSGIVLGHYDFTLQAQGLFDSPPPLIQLPAPLFIGSTSIRGASTHFGKVTRPDGVMLQLGQRSSDRDVWLWVPSGTSHNQSSPWSSALALSHWRECNELHFISGLPPGGLPPQGIQLITSTADFIRHFPHMSAMGARQHPQQGPLLSGSGGGGGGTGGGSGSGGTGGGPTRPATGLLWPRGM